MEFTINFWIVRSHHPAFLSSMGCTSDRSCGERSGAGRLKSTWTGSGASTVGELMCIARSRGRSAGDIYLLLVGFLAKEAIPAIRNHAPISWGESRTISITSADVYRESTPKEDSHDCSDIAKLVAPP